MDDQTIEDKNLADLAAAFNGHQVTDDEGGVLAGEAAATQNTAAEESNTSVEETATAEKPVEPKAQESKPAPGESESDDLAPAVDEAGRRYVPEKRFKEIYGKAKQTERELSELKNKLAQGEALLQTQPKTPAPKVDKTEMLEIEMLKATLPQFNPDSDQYSEELDALGAEIYEANKAKGVTRIDAARRAVKYARDLSKKVEEASAEARIVKTQQSDQGITSRVVQRDQGEPNPESMTLEEKEAYLRRTGQW